AIPAAVAIRQYFHGIKIARAPSVVRHFRVAAGALAAAYAAVNRGRACNT
nr:prepilin-type cleavage/methylation domain-containing protein [Acidithiobacillus ferruginosus]